MKLKELFSFTKSDKDGVATPADWRRSDDVCVPTAGSCGTAKGRMESKVMIHTVLTGLCF